MPPRSPASSVRRAAAAASRGVGAEDAERHPPEQQEERRFATPPTPSTPGAATPGCRRAMTAPFAAAGGDVGGAGEGGGAFSLPFRRAALSVGVDNAEEEDEDEDAASENSTSSSDGSSSGGAIMALGAREEADSRDELIGILVPSPGRAADGQGALAAAHASGSPLVLPAALGVNVNTDALGLAQVRDNISASSSSSGSSGSSAGGGRRIGHFRALSSTCLEGLEPARNHHRRERSGSLLGEMRGRLKQYVCAFAFFLLSFALLFFSPKIENPFEKFPAVFLMQHPRLPRCSGPKGARARGSSAQHPAALLPSHPTRRRMCGQ